MSEGILEWLDGHDVGMSSKALALVALGRRPTKGASYPHDGDDFGRCYRLLTKCPEAKIGLDRLAEISPVWKALADRWAEIEEAYHHDKRLPHGSREYRCYELMQSIIRPAEKECRSPPIHLGNGVSISLGTPK